jgi:hypothetical protein
LRGHALQHGLAVRDLGRIRDTERVGADADDRELLAARGNRAQDGRTGRRCTESELGTEREARTERKTSLNDGAAGQGIGRTHASSP